MLDFNGANGLINPQSEVDPLAALHMLVTDPEAIIPHLAAAGIQPPDRGKLQQFASFGSTPQVSEDGRISSTPYTPNPVSTIAGSGIVGPGEATPGVIPQSPSAPGISPSLGGLVNPLVGGNGTGMMGLTPSAFGPPLPFGAGGSSGSEGQTEAEQEAIKAATVNAAGAPLDITSPAQKAGKDYSAPGSKSALDNAIRAFQGVKMPPAPPIQRLDSPRLAASHPISQNPPAVAALLHQLLGSVQPGGGQFRLGQAVK